MADKSHSSGQLIEASHISELTSLNANFMSARSNERSFMPQAGANWWSVQFANGLELQTFVAVLFDNGFAGELSMRGAGLEIQATQADCIELVKKRVESPAALAISALDSTVVGVVNDAHALFNNQIFNGGLVTAGDELCWLQFTCKQSGWLLLDALSDKLSSEQVVHFDPKGELIVRGGEETRADLNKWLKPFCK